MKTLLAILVVATSLQWACQAAHNRTSQFDCLPDDVALDRYVTRIDGRRITVTDKLIEVKARCRGTELVDGNSRGIRFFRPYCGGAAPPEFLLQRKRDELKALQEQYTVIVLECDMDLPALPR